MLERFFQLRDHGTTIGREAVAGVTTFLTMAYILFLHPAILAQAGFDKPATVAVTAIVACVSTIAMGLYARRPFALAPYMGENAYIAFTVVLTLGVSPEKALGAVFISGVVFVVITVIGLRAWLAKSVPPSLKFSFVVGIGLFLTFIGLTSSGIIVKPDAPGSPPVHLGAIESRSFQLACAGLLLMLALHVLRVRMGILIGICLTAAAGFCLEVTKWKDASPSLPDLSPLVGKLDVASALTFEFLPVILTIFILDFFDTMGTLIGVSARGGFLDDRGDLPQIRRPMLVDAFATVGGSFLGTTTTGTFIESAAGIEAGGRTGLTAVVTGLCFLPAIFLADYFTQIPAYAYGPALIIVGVLMFESVRYIDLDDETEAIPAFLTIVLMAFTYNIGHGIAVGLVAYPLLKLIRGRVREVPLGLWLLAGLAVVYWISFAEISP